VGVVRPRRALGDAQGVGIDQRALLGDHEIDVRVVLHHLGDVAVVLQHQVDIAGHQHVLAVVVVERLHIGLLADQHLLDLGDQLGRDVVDAVAQVLGGQADQVGAFRQQGDAAVILGAVEQVLPAVGHAVHLGLA
jgi:hypothetical protein